MLSAKGMYYSTES